MDLGNDYLSVCKLNYSKGITPSNNESKSNIDCIEILEIGKNYINEFGFERFSYFLSEGQYLVALWTAHIILHIVNANVKIVKDSIDTIKEYADNLLNLKVSKEEQEWLDINLYKYE